MSEQKQKRVPRSPGKIPAASAAPVKAVPEGLNDLLDDPIEETETPAGEVPAEPEEAPVLTRKQAEKNALLEAAAQKAKNKGPKVVPTDDLVRDKKGNVRKDEDGDEMRHAPGFRKGLGFVSENGVLFPPHFKFEGGFIGSFGNVILNKCPKCGHRQGVDDARMGICGRCRFDKVAELELVEL